MMNWRLPAAVLLSAILGAAPGLHAQATRRALYVSALDKTGAPVSDLAPSDIAVREDNVAREVLTVAPAVEPMQIAILVDNSQAAAPFIRDYREALAALVDGLTSGEGPGTRNEVAIITMAERPTIATDYTTDRGALVKSVQRVFSSSDSGTYLLDAVMETSQGFTKRRSPRPVIVAIVTEGPELSDRFYQHVLTTLRASGAALHVITVGRPTNVSHDRSRGDLRRPAHHGRAIRHPVGKHRPHRPVEAGGRGADASVPRHLLAPPVLDPARTHHCCGREARPDGPWHTRGRRPRTGTTVTSHFRRGFRLRVLLGALAAPVVLIGGTPQTTQKPANPKEPAEGQSPAFRAGVDLVSLNVSVSEGPRFVTDLQQEDFQVFEDGVKQDVTFFTRSNLPVALALLIDTSASMESRLPTAQEAAVGFARRLRQQDLAEVVDFDSRVVILQPFTNTVHDLEQAIRRTSAGGSTSMYNAIYIALKDLKRIVAKNVDEIRRQSIVVLSDGEDTSSLLPFDEVLDLAKRSETAIYAIGLGSVDGSSSNGRGFKEAEFVLRQLSQETGGRAFFPSQLADLANVYGQISDELSSQYTVGYTSRNTRQNGAWRRVVVRVNRPNLTARTKQGYFAPTGK